MRCYSGQHRFYVGVDRHARSMFNRIGPSGWGGGVRGADEGGQRAERRQP